MDAFLSIIKWLNWVGSGVTIIIILLAMVLVDTTTSIGLIEIILLLIFFALMPLPGILIHLWQKHKRRQSINTP